MMSVLSAHALHPRGFGHVFFLFGAPHSGIVKFGESSFSVFPAFSCTK